MLQELASDEQQTAVVGAPKLAGVPMTSVPVVMVATGGWSLVPGGIAGGKWLVVGSKIGWQKQLFGGTTTQKSQQTQSRTPQMKKFSDWQHGRKKWVGGILQTENPSIS